MPGRREVVDFGTVRRVRRADVGTDIKILFGFQIH